MHQSLFDALKDLPIEMIVNTHAHEDHIGCNSFK
ncbi:MAG: MBL fold metallo-hydrolase [Proteobacteria bacterium]|nr:MBL fold metallo-hydrolase [Pseudomonadota bacterium]